MYMLMLCAVLPYYINFNKKDSSLSVVQIIIVSMFFFGGVFKLNPFFLDQFSPDVFPSLTNYSASIIKVCVACIPYIEIIAAVLLLFKHTKKHAAKVLMVTMFAIIIFLSPLGVSWNVVVLPWDIAIVLLLYFLFIKNSFDILPITKILHKNYILVPVVLLVVVTPLLYFFGAWDAYISFALYTNNVNRAYIITTPQDLHTVSKNFQPLFTPYKNNIMINTQRWSFNELNVPTYPQERIFLKVFNDFCMYSPLAQDNVKLLIQYQKPFFKKASRDNMLSCADITQDN